MHETFKKLMQQQEKREVTKTTKMKLVQRSQTKLNEPAPASLKRGSLRIRPMAPMAT
jgi:hypothetical protein